MDQPSDDKHVRSILHEHKENVVAQVEALRAQIALIRDRLTQKETELIQINRALAAIGDTETFAEICKPQARPEGLLLREDALRQLAITIRDTQPSSLKIKELLALAFIEHFQQGASPAELKEKIQAAYGRDIDPGSIRPNLARLREDGVVMRSTPPKWILDPAAGNIMGYEFFRFTQPTDDFWDSPLIKAAQALAWREEDDLIHNPDTQSVKAEAVAETESQPVRFRVAK
jgi:hypothetical protein